MGAGKVTARALALRMLTALDGEGRRTDALSEGVTAEEGLSDADKAFVRMLVSECLRRRMTLDDVIARYTKPDKKIRPLVRNVLRMGIAQILYFDRVPDAAAVSSSVDLMKARGIKHLAGFVNGVLRSVCAEKDSIVFSSISIRYSTPEWISDLLSARYGERESERILDAHLHPAWVTLRLDARMSVKRREETFDRIIREVTASHPKAEAQRHPYGQTLLRLRRAGDVTRIYGYEEGLWMVQDAAAALIVPCAGIRQGDVVIDVCASPGGKALQCAEIAGGEEGAGNVFAFDISEDKCARIRDNVRRMRLRNVTVSVQDAKTCREDLKGKADVVLCDLPCSGLGVLKHKPEIKYRLQKEDIVSLNALQKEILQSAVSYLKEGGVLLYSTCTLTGEENDDMADWIIRELPLCPDDLTPFLPEVLRGKVAPDHKERLTILPYEQDTDGAFLARFRKR